MNFCDPEAAVHCAVSSTVTGRLTCWLCCVPLVLLACSEDGTDPPAEAADLFDEAEAQSVLDEIGPELVDLLNQALEASDQEQLGKASFLVSCPAGGSVDVDEDGAAVFAECGLASGFSVTGTLTVEITQNASCVDIRAAGTLVVTVSGQPRQLPIRALSAQLCGGAVCWVAEITIGSGAVTLGSSDSACADYVANTVPTAPAGRPDPDVDAGTDIGVDGGSDAGGIDAGPALPTLDWSSTSTSISVIRDGYCTASAANKLVFASGLDVTQDPVDVPRTDIYDLTTGEWTQVDFPAPRRRMNCLSGADTAYFTGGNRAIGGGDPLRAVYAYDPVDDSFEEVFFANPQRFDSSLGQCGSTLMVAGGTYLPRNPGSFASTAQVDLYDLESATASTHQLSQPRSFGAMAVVGDQLFFAGGREQRLLTQFTTELHLTKAVDVYDCTDATWTTQTMPSARLIMDRFAPTIGSQTFFSGTDAFAEEGVHDIREDQVGGADPVPGRVDVYDSGSDSWSTMDLPLAWDPTAVTAYNGLLLYAFNHPATTVLAYDPGTTEWAALEVGEPSVVDLHVVDGQLVVVYLRDDTLALDVFTPN